jgi:hypothetical protein
MVEKPGGTSGVNLIVRRSSLSFFLSGTGIVYTAMPEIQAASFADVAPLLGRMGPTPPDTTFIVTLADTMRSLRSHYSSSDMALSLCPLPDVPQ